MSGAASSDLPKPRSVAWYILVMVSGGLFIPLWMNWLMRDANQFARHQVVRTGTWTGVVVACFVGTWSVVLAHQPGQGASTVTYGLFFYATLILAMTIAGSRIYGVVLHASGQKLTTGKIAAVFA
jgi:hypothetical protein